MIKKVLINAILLISLINTCAYSEDFSSTATIESSGNKKYKAIRLAPEIYNNSNENLWDIRIFDQDGQQVPYVINSFVESSLEETKTYELEMIDSFVKDEFFYMDYAIKIPQQKDVIATSIEVETDNDGFAKKIEFLGGYDNQHWEKIKEDYLYSVEGNKKLKIELNGCKYTHYRFKISNNLEKISFHSVRLNYSNITYMKENFMESIMPDFTIEEKDKATMVTLHDLKNLKLDNITIETDSTFKRNVNFEEKTSKILYHLNFQDTRYQDLKLPLNGFRVNEDTAVLTINNGDDQPIHITNIAVGYYVDELIFDGSKGGDFILKFGDAEVLSAPSYDIKNYKDLIIKEGYDVLNIKEISTQAPERQKSEYDYKWIFNIVIILVAVIMGVIILLKLR